MPVAQPLVDGAIEEIKREALFLVARAPLLQGKATLSGAGAPGKVPEAGSGTRQRRRVGAGVGQRGV